MERCLNTVILDESQLRQLIDAQESASVKGDTAEATRLLSIAQSAAPDHALVLNAAGVQALRSGKLAEARTLLDRAIARDPNVAYFYMNLATTLRQMNEADAEMTALQKALALDPYFTIAIFQKASLLEIQGKKKLAATAWHAGLLSMQPGTRLPAALHPVIERAQRAVSSGLRDLEELLNSRMQDVRHRYPRAEQKRVDECLAAFFGKQRIYIQQPTLTHFPRLPAIPFFERQDFAWLPQVEAATDDIRSELLQLLEESDEEFAPYVTHPPDAPLNQWRELNNSRRWTALFLFKDGQRFEHNIARCPASMAALAAAPQVIIPERGPTAFFSRLEPKTRIPPHTGSTNTRLTVHIPLIVPPNCRFRVGSEVREWQPGTALIFDDTIEHEAWNDSDQPRVVMIFDIWNPLLTPAERDIMAAATAAIAEYSSAGDP